MRTVHRPGRIIGVLAASLMLAACSLVTLGYNSLPLLTFGWLDGYIDFDDTQAPRVREDLARLHQWHRAHELPRYAALLQQMEQLAPGEPTAAQACAVYDSGRRHLLALAERAEPMIVSTALSLQPAQLAHLAQRFQRRDEEWRRDWVERSPGQRQDKRITQSTERLERLYGRLEPAQRQVLREQVARSVFDPQRVLAERQRRQADLLETLRRLQAPALPLQEARQLWRGFMARTQASPDANWQRHAQALTQEQCALFAAVHAAASPAQREAAAARLRSWRQDLAALAPQQP